MGFVKIQRDGLKMSKKNSKREMEGESRHGNNKKGLLASMAEKQSWNYDKRSHIAGDRDS